MFYVHAVRPMIPVTVNPDSLVDPEYLSHDE
jgi:hypothetical protein